MTSASDTRSEPAGARPAPLLAADEPGPLEALARRPSRPALLVCDHASARIPRALGTLGLPPAALADHIALDIGAAALTRALSEQLGLPAILGNYSRLVVDCNRRLDDPSAFPERSDGREIPGNLDLDPASREHRAEALYWPYHHALRNALTGLEALARAPALLAIHSFTPVYGGVARPWHAGVLWDRDPRIPRALLDGLAAEPGLVIGDNEPYSGRHPADFTIDHHAEAEGLPHVSIEIRQDLIMTSEGVRDWSERLSRVLGPVLADDRLYTHWTGQAAGRS